MVMLPLGVTQPFEVVFGDFSLHCGYVQNTLEAVILEIFRSKFLYYLVILL
jgi:hypothetical protein